MAAATTRKRDQRAYMVVYNAAYRAAHRERECARSAAYYAAHRDESRAYGAARRALASSLKARPCADCGTSYPACVMDYDHRPGTAKVGNVGEMASGARERLLAEIAKCDVVCSNCHRIRTAARRGQRAS